MTLTADVQISGLQGMQAGRADLRRAGGSGPAAAAADETQADPLELLTVEQVAKLLHVSRDKVYCLIRTGQLRSIKIGNLRRISRAWIAEFLTASLPKAPAIGP